MKKITKIGFNFLIFITIFTMTISCDNEINHKKLEKPTELDANKVFLKEMEKLEKERKVQITDEMIQEHIKNDPKKMKEIKSEANIRANDIANEKLLNASLEELFKNDPQQLEIYRKLISMMPNKRTKETLLAGLTESIIEINRTITDIKNGKLKGINIVPISLQKLLSDLKENEKRVREFQMEK